VLKASAERVSSISDFVPTITQCSAPCLSQTAHPLFYLNSIATVQSGSAEPFFSSYDADMPHVTNKLKHRLRKAPQPPLSYPGASADRDRARQPALSDPPCNDQPLVPGDRVEGLGDFGKPTGIYGTVERTNDDDALVKWDDDGRVRLRQPWLKKVRQRGSRLHRPTAGGLHPHV
jgi:hypothetical protein